MENNEKKNQKPQVDKSAEEQEAYLKVVKPLRTYERDVAEKVREGGASTVSVHLEERKKKGVPEEARRKRSAPKVMGARTILIIVGILVVIVTGVFAVFNFVSNTRSPDLASEEKGISIIKADSIITLDVSDEDREGIAIVIEENLGVPPSGLWITNFLLTEKNVFGLTKPLSSKSFFSKLSAQVPPRFLRALGEAFNIGFLTFSSTKEGFILSEIDSFENAFAGMLDWEKSLVIDLESLITSSNDSPSGTFRDIVIKNEDSRILRDKAGKSIIIYSFIGDDLLLIARNEETFREILDRYVVTKFRS
jgi:hypothetical protein